MSTMIVVALPEKDEPVWEYSSEKKPHLTLLYLSGPLDTDEQKIIEFVRHAAETSLSKFGLSVERRGTLGEDDADVLFFDTQFVVPELRSFRAQLLKNDEIAKSYVRVDQFPGWIPHLTMGYPEKPAKEVDSDHRYSLSHVRFDRIAVWTSDYEGPEFELKSDYRDETTSGYWSDSDEKVVAHFGVKGMRWGVRRAVDSNGLVKGTVKDAIKSGQKPRADKDTSVTKGKKSSTSSEHKRMVEDLKRDVSELSTIEIRTITARIKAMNEFNDLSAKQKEAQKSRAHKLASWAFDQAKKGAKKQAENYLQELSGDLVTEVLPKTISARKKLAKEAADAAEKEHNRLKDINEFNAKQNDKNYERYKEERAYRDAQTEKQSQTTTSESSESSSSTSSSREVALNNLADAILNDDGSYDVSSMPKKGKKRKGG